MFLNIEKKIIYTIVIGILVIFISFGLIFIFPKAEFQHYSKQYYIREYCVNNEEQINIPIVINSILGQRTIVFACQPDNLTFVLIEYLGTFQEAFNNYLELKTIGDSLNKYQNINIEIWLIIEDSKRAKGFYIPYNFYSQLLPNIEIYAIGKGAEKLPLEHKRLPINSIFFKNWDFYNDKNVTNDNITSVINKREGAL